MLPRLILVVVLLAGISFGGYTAYNNYYNAPEKVVARATENVSKLKTVHADMNISSTTRVTDTQGNSKTQQSDISGISELDIAAKTQKTHMTFRVSGNSIDIDVILLTAGQMYMKMALLGPDWISMDLQTLREQGALPFDPQSNDYVTQSLGFLKSVKPGSISKLEDETVDGVKASRYRVDISTPQYVDYMKQIGQTTAAADAFKDSSVKSDIWVDQKTGYIIKMTSEIKNVKIKDPKTGMELGTTDMTMTINYSKFNQPVNISKPEGNIVSFEEMMQKATQAK